MVTATTKAEHGIHVDWMNTSINPGDDFYQYANGAWLSSMEIPAAYPRWGAFLILREDALEKVHGILKDAPQANHAKVNNNERKIGDFYFSGMDEAAIEKAGAQPLEPELHRIDKVRTAGQLADVLARLHQMGVSALFGFGSDQDLKNSDMVIAQAAQAGLGLPDRDYYLKDDPKSVELRAKYVQHIAVMFSLLGDAPDKAKQSAEEIMALETQMAQAFMSKVDLRDPHKRYNKMTVDEWQTLVPALSIKRYLSQLGVKKLASLNVGQPDYFKALQKILTAVPVEHVKKYLRWTLLNTAAACLSSDFVNEKFAFYGKTLSGTTELQPRWKRVVERVSSMLGEAVGQVYVREYFPPAAKSAMLELVENVKAEMREAILKAGWMSEATRQNALAKLGKFKTKIGYPDKWIDYSTLQIGRASYVTNMFNANRFAAKRELAEIDKPVDRSVWHMSPQTVNAYFSPTLNEIVFPAAILQSPFFDFQAPLACNYGGIGAVIAHEITHGYDDKGCKFDGEGNLNDWWTVADRAEFDSRTALIKTQCGNFKIETGESLNPDLVCGEASADLGGVNISYRALQRVLGSAPREKDENGFTPEQLFFLAFAQVWAGKYRPEYAQVSVKTDPHPPGNFRCNNTLANVPEFAQAFGLPEDCPMMLPPDKRCQIW